jgi:putative toxin-antitoxin system antitoxin component (TIGR02293 family)
MNHIGGTSASIGGHTGTQPDNRVAATPAVRDVVAFMPVATDTGVRFVEQVRAGWSLEAGQQHARQLAAKLDITLHELALLLATAERTFARQLSAKPSEKTLAFTKAQTERLLLLQALANHGVEVFEDQGKFNRWLRRPLPLLQQQSPLQLLDTVTGFRVVDQLLGRIAYGVYS